MLVVVSDRTCPAAFLGTIKAKPTKHLLHPVIIRGKVETAARTTLLKIEHASAAWIRPNRSRPTSSLEIVTAAS
jgi:hypothetical protein